MGVFVILGTALVGLMAAAMGAWRQGEAGRQANERLQTLQRQLADDLAAAVLDQPPPPDFHFVLDTLHDLSPTAGDPYNILDTAITPTQDNTRGRELSYLAPSRPGTATVLLRIRVPFIAGAALLQARTDVFGNDSAARVWVACNDATLVPPAGDPEAPPADGDAAWKQLAYIQGEGIGGGETDVSDIFRNPDGTVRLGNIIFVKAELDNQSSTGDAAQFLRSDRLRAGGRPVLILDCYRDPNALGREPDKKQPRPTFAAFVRNGAQVLTFTRTLPPEVAQAAARTAGSPASAEYYNHTDDNNNGQIDEGHRPLAGRAQVVYVVRPYEPSLGRPGLGVLRRAFEAPLRRPGTLDSNVLSPNVVTMIDGLPRADGTPPTDFIRGSDFIPHVLHFGVSFWGADTTTWEDRADLGPNYDANTQRPASTEWLSSRYLPEQVQVTAVLEPDRGKRTTTGLAQAIDADYPTATEAPLDVANTQGFDAVQRGFDLREKDGEVLPPDAFVRDPRHFIKIDDEWLFYSGIASPTEFILPSAGASRGARGTKPAAHAAGAEVYRGTVSAFTVRIPAYHHWER